MKLHIQYARYEVFMAMKIQVIFWVVILCSEMDTNIFEDHTASVLFYHIST